MAAHPSSKGRFGMLHKGPLGRILLRRHTSNDGPRSLACRNHPSHHSSHTLFTFLSHILPLALLVPYASTLR